MDSLSTFVVITLLGSMAATALCLSVFTVSFTIQAVVKIWRDIFD